MAQVEAWARETERATEKGGGLGIVPCPTLVADLVTKDREKRVLWMPDRPEGD
ncbi:hypothetical protein PCE31106_01308 [Pandoraea cepalis]|uniref:Uncharacterized protein n=1 Tax=Pandoraea cepalis TaxID=2508294 RepID=A0A5E4TFZ1_9BURK|nr:hypothetical protein [Pandoraea cepalis]VVD85059.1 hypothetical protein PCE31106_01308 [Pandoraea cepalis]